MSWSHTTLKETDVSQFYELVADVKDEIINSDVGVPQDEHDKHERNTNLKLEMEEFNRHTFQNQTLSLDEINIKYEEIGFKYNSTSNSEGDRDIDPDPDSIFSNMNTKNRIHCPINSEQIKLSEFYLRLLQCEQDCETCQRYIRELSEHIMATHATGQLRPDPLHVDPLEMDQSSAVLIKSEVGEDIERKDCPEGSDPCFDIVSGRESEVGTTKNRGRRSCRKQILTERKRSQTKYKGFKLQFKCTKCGKDYATKSCLTIHMRTHTGHKLFQCSECKKIFSQKVNLDYHMRSHTGEKLFECNLCLKSFSHKSRLDNHTRSHTAEKTFTCTICGKGLSCKNSLNYHMGRHTGDLPFKCEFCLKVFQSKGNLAVHMRVHTRDKPFKCDKCDKSYEHKAGLDYHIANHALGRIFSIE